METQNTERMTYKEVSQYLGKPVSTIKQAIDRGVLTPLPRLGRERHILTEQVKLFEGKPLALSSLTSSELMTWEETVKIATGKFPTKTRVIPHSDDDDPVGYERGGHFGKSYKRGAYDAIRSYDPLTEEDLRRPLAV